MFPSPPATDFISHSLCLFLSLSLDEYAHRERSVSIPYALLLVPSMLVPDPRIANSLSLLDPAGRGSKLLTAHNVKPVIVSAYEFSFARFGPEKNKEEYQQLCDGRSEIRLAICGRCMASNGAL